MRKCFQAVLYIWLAQYLLACSSFSKLENSLFKNSTLNNLNPAPATMSPPSATDTDSLLVDPVYLRSQADYHYTLGESLSLDGNSERAIEEFKLTLIYDPDAVVVRLRLAAEYVKQGLLSESIEQAELAVKSHPESIEGRLLLGGLYSSMKMYDKAMAEYKAAIKIEPENMDVPVYIGALLAEQKQFDDAEDHFLKLAKKKKFKKPHLAYYYIGVIRLEQGGADNVKKAEQAFLKSISLKPKNAETVLALSRLYEKQEQKQKSLKLLESFQNQYGPNRKIARKLSYIYLEDENYDKAFAQLEYLEGFEADNLNVKLKIALILIEQKKYYKAVDKLEEIVRVAPESDKIRFYLGAVYEEINKKELAISHFSKIHSSSIYFAEAVLHSAYLYKQLKDAEGAMTAVIAGIDQRDDIPQFYAFYASLLDDKKDYQTAVNMLEKAVKKFPTHTQLRFFLGSMYDRTGRTKQSITEMKKVIEIDENHIQAINYLAYTYAEQNINLNEAMDLATKAISMDPNDGYILDTMGWILFKQGKTQEAIKYLEAAYKNKSNESIVAEHLGDAYYRYELMEKAKKMYQRAVAIEKDEAKRIKIKVKIVSIDNQKSNKRKPANKP